MSQKKKSDPARIQKAGVKLSKRCAKKSMSRFTVYLKNMIEAAPGNCRWMP